MSRLRVRKSTEAPPDEGFGGGYRFVHETGYISRGLDVGSWMADIRKHRRDNGLPIPDDMQSIAEDQMCRTAPPGLCYYEDTGQPWVNGIEARVDLGDAINATKVFAAFVAEGMPLVEQSVAEERAAICAACPANVAMSGCGACVGIAETVARVVGAGKTRADAQLANKSCAWCKCSSRAQVWVPIEILENGITDEHMKRGLSHCWKFLKIKELRAK